MMEGLFMLPALGISVFQKETMSVKGFAWSIGVILLLSLLCSLYGNKSERRFYAKEGMVCVGFSWILLSVLGCLPFYISREIPSFVDALFETVSGFTTTGASILSSVEDMSKGLLYWRSFSHWIGGMGVLVFVLAITSVGGSETGFTMHLLRAESAGPNVGKLTPKMKTTASILYWMYIALTALNVVFLLLGEMPVFEALCTAFGTAGTGGFGVANDSLAGYSPYIQNVTSIFMLLFGVNFSFYYLLMMKRFREFFKEEELRMYLGCVLIAVCLIVWNLRGVYDGFGETLRHALFQVSSIITTTGFATTDFAQWPEFSKAVLLCLMAIGACAGSTAGGFKCSRVLLLMKNARRSIRKVVRPQKVQAVRCNGHAVGEKVLDNISSYLVLYVLIIASSFFLISVDGYDLTTNISAVMACVNNVGPGFGLVGPTGNYGGYSILSKLVLIVDMLVGRLEIFPILILISRSTWRRK